MKIGLSMPLNVLEVPCQPPPEWEAAVVSIQRSFYLDQHNFPPFIRAIRVSGAKSVGSLTTHIIAVNSKPPKKNKKIKVSPTKVPTNIWRVTKSVFDDEVVSWQPCIRLPWVAGWLWVLSPWPQQPPRTGTTSKQQPHSSSSSEPGFHTRTTRVTILYIVESSPTEVMIKDWMWKDWCCW